MVDFPISGPYRELILTLELIVLFTFMELSVVFFSKYWKNRKASNPSIVEFDWGVIFACFGMAILFYIVNDFYEVDRLIFAVCGYFSLAIGGLIFMYHIESSKVLKTRFLFTTIFGGITIMLLILFLVSPSLVKSVAYTLAVFAMGIIVFYFFVIIKRIWNQYRIHSIGLFLGVVLWLLGFAGTSDPATSLFNGFEIRVVGDILILASLLCISLFLTSIPSLAEIGWQGKVKYVVVTTNNGINIYSENFREKKEINEVLVAGALWGIQVFLETVLLDSSLKVISKGKDIVLIEHGKYVTGILIVEQELEILKALLKKLVLQFEYFYANIVQNWKGDLSVFKPTAHLINDIFSLKKDK